VTICSITFKKVKLGLASSAAPKGFVVLTATPSG